MILNQSLPIRHSIHISKHYLSSQIQALKYTMETFEYQNFTPETEFKNLGISEFEECTFNDINFSNISLRSWRFIKCTFKQCRFSEVDINGTLFREPSFQNCQLMGINWASAQTIANPKFKACKLDYSIFQGLDLRKVPFIDCSAKDVDFTETKLSEAIFSGTHLQNASFIQADLSNCDLRNASEYFIDPQFTKLKGTKVNLHEASTILNAIGFDVYI